VPAKFICISYYSELRAIFSLNGIKCFSLVLVKQIACFEVRTEFVDINHNKFPPMFIFTARKFDQFEAWETF
jgi:hypothetical protein